MSASNGNRRLPNARELLIGLVAFLIALSAEIPGYAAGDQSNKTKPKAEVLSGTIWQNQVIDGLESVGAKCIIQTGSQHALIVDSVRMGSKAYYKGLTSGDIIRQVQPGSGSLNITFDRGGKTYQLSVPVDANVIAGWDKSASMLTGQASTNSNKILSARTEQDKLAGNTGDAAKKPNAQQALKSQLASASQPIKVADVSEKNKPPPMIYRPITDSDHDKLLLEYDIEILIDRSGSMNQPDGTGQLSKWDWCEHQVQGLGSRLAAYKRKINLTLFSDAYQTDVNVPADQIEHAFTAIPQGGTDLVDPLLDRLNEALRKHSPKSKPLLVGIITDGEPNIPIDPQAVDRALVGYTQMLSKPNQVLIIIFKIGDSAEGRAFCTNLSTNLKNEGAQYQIVEAVSFDELKALGLTNALAQKIFDNHERELAMFNRKHFIDSVSEKSERAKEAEKQGDARTSERHDLEQKLLKQ